MLGHPGVSPQINIYSEDAEDFASGVPFYQWLKHVTIQVPKPTGPLGNPLQLDGGAFVGRAKSCFSAGQKEPPGILRRNLVPIQVYWME